VCHTFQSRFPRLSLMSAYVTHMAAGGNRCRVGTVFADITTDMTSSDIYDAISFMPQFQLR